MVESIDEWWQEEFMENLNNFKLVCVFISIVVNILKFGLMLWYGKGFVITPSSMALSGVTVVFIAAIYHMKLKYNRITVFSATIFLEILTFMMFYSAHYLETESYNILLMESTFATVFFECTFFRSLWINVFILIKHITLWHAWEMIFEGPGITGSAQIISIVTIITMFISREFLARKISYGRYSYRKKLEVTEKRLQIILQAFPDGLIILNSKLIPELVNEKMLQFLGCNFENIMETLSKLEYAKGKKLQNLNTFSHNLMEDLKSYDLQESGELNLGIIEFRNYILQWKVKKIKFDGNHIILISAANSEQLIKLEQTQAENRCKSYMLRTISHELRTPISAIITFADQAKEDIVNPETLEKLSHIRTSGNILLNFINDILDYIQITQGMFALNKTKFNIRDKINECCNQFGFMAKRKGINFTVRIDPSVPDEIFTDPERLNQVLMNFLSNAIKFTSKGSIELSAILAEDDRLKFCISDTGIGIPEQRYKQLFELFKNHNSEEIASHGCGLGLHLSSLIIKVLGGGKIFVTSSLGKGTVFSFKIDIFLENSKQLINLDFMEDLLDPINPVKVLAKNSTHNYPKVLIVDDNDFNREVLASLLQRNKIQYIEAINGKKAVKAVLKQDKKKIPIKLVIMDCSMPVMDGWEATKEIKRLWDTGKLSHMPAIVGHTAYNSDKDVTMCYASGMVSFIAKPASPDIILKTVSQYVQF
ncbi:unnamed protein product [Blepharisma stoltei]|uniref:histidine kinase n=1 Tax=Blepharisma stoltei TaxID=1481888 RepID=A0AAU9I9B4_9CILI|nr:unnamed protein product [Blepharisma stoltei]